VPVLLALPLPPPPLLPVARAVPLALLQPLPLKLPLKLTPALRETDSVPVLAPDADAAPLAEGEPEGERVTVARGEPVGVAGLISPWNLPLYLLTWKVAPALAAGNCVVAKPSEVTPRTASALAAIAHAAGLPPGVLNVVHGLGGEAGAVLVAHPRVPLISFTGGTATGKLVAAAAAPMFKKLSLELGGKNATVVFADVASDRAWIGSGGAAAVAGRGQPL
jgi:aminomuconate-semialdehyde/2-hydroxymuconate-6-semialdehyde dehydrogenase